MRFAHLKGICCSPDNDSKTFSWFRFWKCVQFCLSLRGNCRCIQCVPLSLQSKYFLFHQWVLWVFFWPPQGRGNIYLVSAPCHNLIQSKGGRKEESKVQGRCGLSCLCHSSSTSLPRRWLAVTMRSIPTPRRIAVVCALGMAQPVRP